MITGIPIVDAIVSIGGLVAPPLFDFVKKKFIGPDRDTPTATLSTLATTKPEIMPQYMESVVHHLEAQVKFFNRDVIGSPRQWVVDLRASIRPTAVLLGFLLLGLDAALTTFDLDPGVRYFIEANTSSWFGHRLTMGGNNGK